MYPESADQSAAIRKLREVVMTANAAIACQMTEGEAMGDGDPGKNAGLNFGLALEAMNLGHAVQRTDWNGKGMFVFRRKGFTASQGENTYDNRYGKGIRQFLFDQPSVTFIPVLCTFTAQKTVVTGWLASQTDMLADDWEIIYDY